MVKRSATVSFSDFTLCDTLTITPPLHVLLAPPIKVSVIMLAVSG